VKLLKNLIIILFLNRKIIGLRQFLCR
jgi:hypothetical protein